MNNWIIENINKYDQLLMRADKSNYFMTSAWMTKTIRWHQLTVRHRSISNTIKCGGKCVLELMEYGKFVSDQHMEGIWGHGTT